MKNREVAGLFEKMADLLEFNDENPFRFGLTGRLQELSETLPKTSRTLPRAES